MAVVTVNNVLYAWIGRISTLVTIFWIVLVLCHHGYNVNYHLKHTKLAWTKSLFLSFILFLFVVVTMAGCVLNVWGSPTTEPLCFISCVLIAYPYLAAKWCFYLLLSFRLGMLHDCYV